MLVQGCRQHMWRSGGVENGSRPARTDNVTLMIHVATSFFAMPADLLCFEHAKPLWQSVKFELRMGLNQGTPEKMYSCVGGLVISRFESFD